MSLVAIFDADRQGFLRNERSYCRLLGELQEMRMGKFCYMLMVLVQRCEAAIQQTLERRERQQATILPMELFQKPS